MIPILYSLIFYPLLILAFKILSFFDPKIKKGWELRQDKAWLRGELKPDLPVYWFHVSSGEFEYAKPVIRELKRKKPCQVLVTYFSPSVVNSLRATGEVDVFLPTPWDTPWNWQEFLTKYKPKCLAIARTDLWPQMIWQTDKNKIPSILFSATLPAHSPRVASFWGRLFYSFVTSHLTHISCVSEDDKDHFLRVNSQSSVSADGDTRFDQVFYRLEQSPPPANLLAFFPQKEKTFIAGSTWPEDEQIILPATRRLIDQGCKIILAPHEVSKSHLQKIENQLMLQKISYKKFSEIQPEDKFDLLLIDRVGILASLYPLASTAFVGGSFKKSVHSVMEPAAAGCFTLVGPFHHNSREALALKTKGFLKEVHSADEIIAASHSQPNSKEIMQFMKSHQGVSQTIANWLLK